MTRIPRSVARLRAAFGPAWWRWIAARLGSRPGKLLGAGLSGPAFALPRRRTVKFGTEADMAAALQLKRAGVHPNVARIHDAFDAPTLSGRKVAVIVRDAVDHPICDGPRWLDPLIGALFADLERGILSHRRTDRERRRRGWSERRMGAETLARWRTFAARVRFADPRLDRIRDGLRSAVAFLLCAGVHDDTVLNTENIGLRDGRAVVFDVTWPGPVPRLRPDPGTAGPRLRPIRLLIRRICRDDHSKGIVVR